MRDFSKFLIDNGLLSNLLTHYGIDLDDNEINDFTHSTVEHLSKIDSKKIYQPYPISSLKENTFYILKQELLFPILNYQIVLYIKNKYDFIYLILIWFLKHRSIWNKLENENIIMNINLNKFLKIFSNEKKE